MYKVIEKYLTPNKYSRPQKSIHKIKGIVIHYVANPNSKAISNRNYFENRKYGKNSYGSAHEIIDLNGDVIVCLPKSEIAYAVGSKTYTKDCLNKLSSYPNNCTYNIECTHVDWNGKMTDKTYSTLIERVADLCIEFNLNPFEDLWTHKEVVGWKICHKWFVENPKDWILFKQKVNNEIKNKISEKVVDEIMNNQKISSWAEDSVKKMQDLGILKGDSNGNTNPHSNVTREELCVFLDRIIKLLGK